RRRLAVAGKRESYEICFIPDNDYNRFLKENVEGLEERVAGGEIVKDGEVIGHHSGFPFYTVGQRKGLGLSSPEPLYVIDIDSGTNRVYVGGTEELMHRGLRAERVNLIKYAAIDKPMRLTAKIRYKDEGAPALVRTLPDGTLEVKFEEPRRAITKGQSVVLYDGDDVVGGGVIREWFD
ncbi:MAG: aminomethyltransferase beta-barrel domain-containing protein, partial [Candidatus Kapaibacterium sp.]